MRTTQARCSDAVPFAQPTAPFDTHHHTHSVHFYEDDVCFLSRSSDLIAAALNEGAAVVVIATKEHREGLARRLRADGVDVARVAREKRYVSLDASDTLSKFLVDDVPVPTRFFDSMQGIFAQADLADGHRQILVLGEMVSLLWEEGNSEAAIRLEQLWNDLAKKRAFSLRCAYPMGGFSREEHGNQLLTICAEHSQVIPVESYLELSTEEERLRAITHLQQRANALESEIAQRKQIEQRLQRREEELADFLENAVEGVQQVGANRKIRWANKSLLSLLGYRKQEYVGHDFAEFHVHRRSFDEYWTKLMRGEDIYDFATELRCKDGSVRHVLIHSNGLWENGRFIHTRCFIRDVTEHKRMEEALRSSEKMAATGRLAASIAHEINNPLEALTNVCYLLQSHPALDEAARRYVTLADQELRRVAHITKQMLAFYRCSADPVPLRLSEILDGVVELYGPKLSRKNLTVNRHYAADELVRGFSSEIRQLFANLLGNAIEASSNNRAIRLHIFKSCDWRNPGRRGVRVSIADSGVGILPAARKNLFEPFFTTKGEAGTGLGLWVSKGIVQKHEGTIRFRSSVRLGRNGSVFSVFLPAATACCDNATLLRTQPETTLREAV